MRLWDKILQFSQKQDIISKNCAKIEKKACIRGTLVVGYLCYVGSVRVDFAVRSFFCIFPRKHKKPMPEGGKEFK